VRRHVHGFATVAPACGDGERNADSFSGELRRALGRFADVADTRLGDDAFDRFAAGVTQISVKNAAVFCAMPMICGSSDSRTPP
jgi:hypothetical protein